MSSGTEHGEKERERERKRARARESARERARVRASEKEREGETKYLPEGGRKSNFCKLFIFFLIFLLAFFEQYF